MATKPPTSDDLGDGLYHCPHIAAESSVGKLPSHPKARVWHLFFPTADFGRPGATLEAAAMWNHWWVWIQFCHWKWPRKAGHTKGLWGGWKLFRTKPHGQLFLIWLQLVAQCKVAIFLKEPSSTLHLFVPHTTTRPHRSALETHTGAGSAHLPLCPMFALTLSTNGLSPLGCKLIRDTRCPGVDQHVIILQLKCSYKSNPEAGSAELSWTFKMYKAFGTPE